MPSRRTLLRSAGLTLGTSGCTGILGGERGEPIPDPSPGGADWPSAGYDARNSRYNAAGGIPRSKPAVEWTRSFGFCHEPFVRGDTVVLNADDSVVGLRAADGEVRWQSTSEPWGFETPTLGIERAYVTGPDCVFGVALDSGDETWRGRPCWGSNTASGTLANGRFYLEHGGYFSALDATGQTTWASRHDVQGSPAVVGETAYVATVFTVEAVDLQTPAREWPWEDPDDDEPAHADEEEATMWSVPPESRIDGPRVYRSPAVVDGTVYATVEADDRPGGELRALDRASGEEQWSIASRPGSGVGDDRTAPDPLGRPIAPVVTADLVVTSLGDRRLRALTPDGGESWTRSLDHLPTDLVAAGETLVAVTHDQSVETTAPGHTALVAFDLASGRRLWEVSFADHVRGTAVAAGTVFVTAVTERTSDGDVDTMRLLALS